MRNLNEKTYNTVLNETNDFFQAQGLSILGRGYEEIANNAALFESYVDALTEGASADSAATMAQLMANSNANILKESSMTGIQPVASLSMPVIRKLWPKFALKEAITTEVAKSPRFVVAYTKPYMYKGDGLTEGVDKIYLPRGLRDEVKNETVAESGYIDDIDFAGALNKELVTLEKAKVNGVASNAKKVVINAGAAATIVFDTTVAETPSAAKLQPIDELIIKASYGTVAAETSVYTKTEDIKIGKRLGVYGNGVYPFAGGQLIVQFDGKARQVVVAAIGAAVELELVGVKSSEYNEESWSVGFDIARQDIDIPTGQHINAPLPVEALNDMMALYQIDGTKETVDLMTNVFAQKLDLEILNFLRDSYVNQPGNEEFQDYGRVEDYTVVFDCKPAAGFAGSPKAWREEIKPLIDHLAQKIKNDTYLQSGHFVLVANPLDVQILANIDWQFRGGQGGNMDGVDVNYSVGTYVGANAYKVIASVNVPVGAMYLVFLPSGNTQMTYKYYPYTFSTEMGYVDPNRSRVPSVMMTKRHTFAEFMPAIGAIIVKNNNAMWFNEAEGYYWK